MTMLATAVGVVIVSVISSIIMFISMICMVVALGNSGSKELTPVKAGTFLTVDMSQISGDREGSNLLVTFNNDNSVGLIDAVNAIRAAAKDDKVAGLLLKGDDGLVISWGSLTDLRDAIAEFKGSKKPVGGLLALMFVFFIAGLALIVMAR